MRRFDVHACSDVTGFGLLGHAYEMASGSAVTIVLESGKLPVLDAAVRLAERGYVSGGCTRNRTYLESKVALAQAIRPGLVDVAFDPQTSGGLLIALPARQAENLLKDLHGRGLHASRVVGRAIPRGRRRIHLL